MAVKDPNFSTSISLRGYLNDLLGEKEDGYEPTTLTILNYGNPAGDKKIYNVQLIWVGDQFYVSGNLETDNGTFKIIPFNEYEWTIKNDPIVYTIYYLSDEGTNGTMSALDYTYGSSNVNFTSNSFTKTGYTFIGWSVDENNLIMKYSNNASIPTDIISYANDDNSINLYAVWAPNEYTILFDGNGEDSGTVEEINYIYNTDMSFPDNENGFVKTGYSFAGWALNSNESDPSNIYNSNSSISNNTINTIIGSANAQNEITFYAIWEEIVS